MFERFTNRARRALVLAGEAARGLDHDYIGTEHLLLGLLETIQLDAPSASAVGHYLSLSGIDVAGLSHDVVATVGHGSGPIEAEHIRFTARSKSVLELSLREALRVGHDHIGTEHLFVALTREKTGVAAQILAKRGVTHAVARDALIGIDRSDTYDVEDVGLPSSPKVS